jgi:hypothetical protein
MRAELGLWSLPVIHGFRHAGREMWTGILNNPQLRWLSLSGDVIPKRPWTAVGAFGPSLFLSDFARGVISQFHTFVSQRPRAFLWVIRLLVLATQLTSVLHSGFWVTCHSSLNLHLCFSSLSRPRTSLLRSEWSIVCVCVCVREREREREREKKVEW